MSKIYDNLFLGDLHTSQNAIFFEKNQIQNILIAAQELKRPFHKTKNYYQINVADREQELIIKHWPACMEFISKSKGNTLVHCLGGVSRSSSTVMAYAMFKEDLTYPKSLKKITKLHSIANPNAGFIKQLEFWEEILSSYRKIIPLGQKESYEILSDLTSKFLQQQEKRVLYHMKMATQSKVDRRGKKEQISESVLTNPIDNPISISTKVIKMSRNDLIQKTAVQGQDNYQQKKRNRNKEGDDHDDDEEEDKEQDEYYYVYNQTEQHHDLIDNNIDYEICYHQQELQQDNLMVKQLQQEQIYSNDQNNLEIEQQQQQQINQNKETDLIAEQWFKHNVKIVDKKKKSKTKQANIF